MDVNTYRFFNPYGEASNKYEEYFLEHSPVNMDKVADSYKKSILGKVNSEIIKILV